VKYIKFLFILLSGGALFSIGYMQYSGINSNELALQVFSVIKNINGESINLSKLPQSDSQPNSHARCTQLLEKYVSDNGLVDYLGF
jgi:hypothetical protein